MNQQQQLEAGDLATVLYRMCLLHLDMRKPTQALQYLERLQKHSQTSESIETAIFCQLAEALILKASQRFKDKGRAQDLLLIIFENDQASERTRFLAMLHLCDLLLQEYKLSNDEITFNHAQKIANDLFELTETWQFVPDRIWSLIFKAKFAMIEGEAQQAFSLLEQAHNVSEDKALTQLTDYIKQEITSFQKELNKWQELTDRNVSIHERIKHAEIESYLLEALKIRNQTLDTRS